VLVKWPDGKQKLLKGVLPNQTITVKQSESALKILPAPKLYLPIITLTLRFLTPLKKKYLHYRGSL
jgi:hypothetical protein